MKFEVNIWKFRMAFSSKWLMNKYVTGYKNRTPDGKLAVTMDYDDMDAESVEMEVDALQKMFKLGDFWLFQTDKGVHAVCPDKLPLWEYKWIIEQSCQDRNQWLIPVLHGNKSITLRMTGKGDTPPKFIKRVESSYQGVREKWSALGLLLESLSGLKPRTGTEDGEMRIELINYRV